MCLMVTKDGKCPYGTYYLGMYALPCVVRYLMRQGPGKERGLRYVSGTTLSSISALGIFGGRAGQDKVAR